MKLQVISYWRKEPRGEEQVIVGEPCCGKAKDDLRFGQILAPPVAFCRYCGQPIEHLEDIEREDTDGCGN